MKNTTTTTTTGPGKSRRASQGQKHLPAHIKQESLPGSAPLNKPKPSPAMAIGSRGDAYDFARTRKSMERPIYELRQMDEMKPADLTPADRIRQRELRVMVVEALMGWVPNVHCVALQEEVAGAAENAMAAHRCLLFAVNMMHTVESLGECYDVEDLEYRRKVRLLSSKGVAIHSWNSVAGYDPFRIILWVWRDICLSVLAGEEDGNSGADIPEQKKAGVVIVRMLDDIRLCIPLDSYDFREKKAKRSLWDLFLKGGFESDKHPTYWPLGFAYCMHRLEQLYVSCRLAELQNHPSYDLYISIKACLPAKYSSQPLAAVENIRHTPPTLSGRIDIFTHERCTPALDALIAQRLLRRDSVRFRNIVLPYSHDKCPAVTRWAYAQVVAGFQEAVDGFGAELAQRFPGVRAAVAGEEGRQVHGLEEFLAAATATGGDTDVEMTPALVAAVATDAGSGSGSDPERGGGPAAAAVAWVYTFRGYQTVIRDWFWGQQTPQGDRLRAQLRSVFGAKLGFLLLHGGFVGKALQTGCVRCGAVELARCLEYLLAGDMGFEIILGTPGGGAEPGEGSAAKKEKKKKKAGTRKARRGVAVAKAKGRGGRARSGN